MSHPNVLDAGDCVLIVVDLQDSLLRVIHGSDKVISNTIKLIETAKIFSVPILLTVQYRDKLGPTTKAVADVLPADVVEVDKTTFSCLHGGCFGEILDNTLRRQAIICGVETHVCVNQTAHDLLAAGYCVQIVSDAVSSRTVENREIGLGKMRQSGCIITSTEMAMFELIRDAGSVEFKRLLPFVK
jgi:nicotinamidase-related amidase